MTRIYKRSDRIPVRIGSIVVMLAPLTIDQRTEIQQDLFVARRSNDLTIGTRAIKNAIRYSVKGVKGISSGSGEPYELQFDEDKNLTSECIDDLLNLENNDSLSMVCVSLVRGIKPEFTDESGKPIDGVEVLKDQSSDGDDSSKNV